MEELRKLIKIVTIFNSGRTTRINSNIRSPANKEEILFINIKSNKYNTDQDAVLDLYGSSEKSYRYRMLKSRLREKLLNELYFIEDPNNRNKNEEKKCLDLIYKGQVLLLVTEYAVAKQLFTKALKIAEKFEFTDFVMVCLNKLNFIHYQLLNYRLYHQTLGKIKYYRRIKSIEEEASDIYYNSKMELQKSVMSQKRYMVKLPSIVNQLRSLWKESNSYNVFYFYYMLNGWLFELSGDFESSIRELEYSEKLLQEGKINPFRFDFLLNKFTKIYALFRAKKFDRGLQLAPQYLKEFNPYSRNWFAFMETYFLTAMHAGKFNLAMEIVIEVDQNPFFKRLKRRAKESWALYKAYLYFLNSNNRLLISFNYQQFITSVPEHSKDKLGENIALHILQFLYYLKNRDYDQLYYREGALRKYLRAYLGDPDSQRSRFFFRLLIIVIRADFKRDEAIKKGQKWIEKLKATPEPGDAYARVEILPYEKLWETVLDLLNNR